MLPRLSSPNRPPEHRSGERLRRFGMAYFVLLSLLVHGLALRLKFDFRPFVPVDRGNVNLSVELRDSQKTPSLAPDRVPAPATPTPSTSRTINTTDNQPTAARQATPPGAVQIRPSPTAIDATDLIERSKAELNTASRRKMLDPMFAAAARHAADATPLERATARGETKIEERGAYVMRVTNADGSRYCLQRLPEIATRDIPVPLVGVPMKCQ